MKEEKKNQNEEKNIPSEEDKSKDLMKELGLLTLGVDFDSDIQYINIIGSIEGHMILPPENKTTKYEHLIPQLIAVEENPKLKGLLVVLNTVGGDVEAGLALAEMISTLSKPTVSLVLGGGHSIGIPLAVSTDYSFIAESATMTLHPIRTSGMVITSETTFDYLRKTQDRVVDFIQRNSHARREKITELMNCTDNMSNDIGTILFGEEAVKIGLIDETGGLSRAIGKLRTMIEEAEKIKTAEGFGFRRLDFPGFNLPQNAAGKSRFFEEFDRKNVKFSNPNIKDRLNAAKDLTKI